MPRPRAQRHGPVGADPMGSDGVGTLEVNFSPVLMRNDPSDTYRAGKAVLPSVKIQAGSADTFYRSKVVADDCGED